MNAPLKKNRTCVGIGQDSHRFLTHDSSKPCRIGGLTFDGVPGLDADSDGDVVLHALCNAITSLTHVPILGKVAIELCHSQGITDSALYLQKALETCTSLTLEHIAFTIEGSRPRLQPTLERMRYHLAHLVQLEPSQIGITVTSGDGLTSFGQGEGLQCFCILTATITT